MSKYVPIGEICYVYDGPHATPIKTKSGPIYLGIDAVTDGGRLNPAEFSYLSESDYKIWTKRVTPQCDDIVFSYEATLGRYAMIPEGFYGCLGRRLAIVRAKDSRVNPRWLYYYFLSPEWSAFIANHTVKGSTVNRISVEDYPNYPIPLPERKTQDAVVEVLSTIDQKIDNNTNLCVELESMAKTLYDYWFTQFDFPDENGKPYRSSGGEMVWNDQLKCKIPKGWTADVVGNLLSKVPNTTRIQTGDYLNDGDIPVVDQSTDFIAGYTNDTGAALSSPTGYIVFGDHTRIVKYVRFSFARGADGTQVLKSNTPRVPDELLYQIIKSIDLSNYGYARHFKFLKDTLAIIPDEPVAKRYAEIVIPIYDKQVQLIFENIELTRLRDWLLPMLMNGQATVE